MGKGEKMDEQRLSISEVAKAVAVENHVLRYWEEELQLEIKRNKNGHRYYTKENVVEFRRIKELKENGLQLKAIRMVLFQTTVEKPRIVVEPDIVEKPSIVEKSSMVEKPSTMVSQESAQEEKVAKIQQLLKQIISEAVQENNVELCKQVQDSVVKELDYQFRLREEAEEVREKARIEREESHYKRIDEVLRGKVSKIGKRKKHSIF